LSQSVGLLVEEKIGSTRLETLCKFGNYAGGVLDPWQPAGAAIEGISDQAGLLASR